MISKKLNKKLVLHKRTITHLNTPKMIAVQGGVKTNPTCPVRTCTLISCEETCVSCYHTCPATFCDTECGC